MGRYKLSNDLLEVKVRDFEINSGLMPTKARILSKMFANSLGQTAGRIVSVYDSMYHQIEENYSIPEIQESVKRDINEKSKVTIQLPFMQPKQARICGLVAMNYSGFFDKEVELYSYLMSDLRNDRTSLENVVQQSRQVAQNNSEVYGRILQEKQQAIYDFGVLMGLVDDDSRLDELKGGMHGYIAKYFDNVVSMHKGGRLGISWPLPLKKFSRAIQESLYRDTISHAVQEGVGEDYGFLVPEKVAYEQVIDQVKTTADETSTRGSLRQKWKTATALPATLFFLSGMNAYAQESSNNVKEVIQKIILKQELRQQLVQELLQMEMTE